MIRFALRCAGGHDFEGWFAGNEAYDKQRAGGLVECPVCGSGEVAKALMAPAVSTARRRTANRGAALAERAAEASGPPQAAAPAVPAGPGAPAAPGALATLDPARRAMLTELREIKARLLAGSKDVGPRFAEEARAIHYGEREGGAIHGQASGEEARALVEEGISIMPLPVLPDERD